MKLSDLLIGSATLMFIGVHAYALLGIPGTTYLIESGLGRTIGRAVFMMWAVGIGVRVIEPDEGDGE